MANLLDLPDEVLVMILKLLETKRTSGSAGVSRTCRRLDYMNEPLLYRRISIGIGHCQISVLKLVRGLHNSPRLGAHVRELQLNRWWYPSSLQQLDILTDLGYEFLAYDHADVRAVDSIRGFMDHAIRDTYPGRSEPMEEDVEFSAVAMLLLMLPKLDSLIVTAKYEACECWLRVLRKIVTAKYEACECWLRVLRKIALGRSEPENARRIGTQSTQLSCLRKIELWNLGRTPELCAEIVDTCLLLPSVRSLLLKFGREDENGARDDPELDHIHRASRRFSRHELPEAQNNRFTKLRSNVEHVAIHGWSRDASLEIIKLILELTSGKLKTFVLDCSEFAEDDDEFEDLSWLLSGDGLGKALVPSRDSLGVLHLSVRNAECAYEKLKGQPNPVVWEDFSKLQPTEMDRYTLLAPTTSITGSPLPGRSIVPPFIDTLPTSLNHLRIRYLDDWLFHRGHKMEAYLIETLESKRAGGLPLLQSINLGELTLHWATEPVQCYLSFGWKPRPFLQGEQYQATNKDILRRVKLFAESQDVDLTFTMPLLHNDSDTMCIDEDPFGLLEEINQWSEESQHSPGSRDAL